MRIPLVSLNISDITAAVIAKGENTTLLRFHSAGIAPLYAKQILSIYLMMEWPLTGTDSDFVRCYAALLPHGNIHVAEVFFLRQKMEDTLTGQYLGTTKVFSVALPENKYDEALDELISEEIWKKVGGHVSP
ncbi:MAG: hypothetical protein ACXWQO_10750 [Bdellovibrionota bacterium]